MKGYTLWEKAKNTGLKQSKVIGGFIQEATL